VHNNELLQLGSETYPIGLVSLLDYDGTCKAHPDTGAGLDNTSNDDEVVVPWANAQFPFGLPCVR
jgi:hypothetical protein